MCAISGLAEEPLSRSAVLHAVCITTCPGTGPVLASRSACGSFQAFAM